MLAVEGTAGNAVLKALQNVIGNEDKSLQNA